MKALLILHRYLGVAIGLMMTLWCLSGFVMMYQSFPAFTRAEQIQALQPLAVPAAGITAPDLTPGTKVRDFQIEMLGSCPVVRLKLAEGPARTYSLCTGREAGKLDLAAVRTVAATYGRRMGAGPPLALKQIDIDQWSVGAGAKRHQPLYQASFDDPARTEVYISGATGEIIQDTTRTERALSWIGAVPHWLYPTLLRQNGELWSQAVIWSAVVGVFLTATGLYVGIGRFRRYRSGRWSPYRGWFFWHHVTGLVFGVLALTWVASGLMTMSPWGLLERSAPFDRETYAGATTWREVEPVLRALPALIGSGGQVAQLKSAGLAGQARVIAVASDGAVRRLTAAGTPAPLSAEEVMTGLRRLGLGIADLRLLTREDDYYYSHHDKVDLPVYRAVLANADQTLIYVDARTGSIARVVDQSARSNRWIVGGLHSLDFAWLRGRPIWDLIVLPLLAGVTLVCATGLYMSVRRVGRDIAGLRRGR